MSAHTSEVTMVAKSTPSRVLQQASRAQTPVLMNSPLSLDPAAAPGMFFPAVPMFPSPDMQQGMPSTWGDMHRPMLVPQMMPMPNMAMQGFSVGQVLPQSGNGQYAPSLNASGCMPAFNLQALPAKLETGSCATMQPTGAAAFAGNVMSISSDPNGCWEIQAFLENGSTQDADRVMLFGELAGNVRESMQSPNANHVLQKFIVVVHPSHLQFVINELARYGFSAAAKHKYGCRVMQRLLEHASPTQLGALVEELLETPVDLSRQANGHFVIVCLLERGIDFERDVVALTQALTEFVLSLKESDKLHISHEEAAASNQQVPSSKQRGENISCVLKAALEEKANETKEMLAARVELAKALLSRTDVLIDLVSAHGEGFRFGPETVSLAAVVAGALPEELSHLIEMAPRNTRYGRDLKKKLQQQIDALMNGATAGGGAA